MSHCHGPRASLDTKNLAIKFSAVRRAGQSDRLEAKTLTRTLRLHVRLAGAMSKLFALTKFETSLVLETLVEKLAHVGLCLHAGKTTVVTSKAQPPQCLFDFEESGGNCGDR